MPTETKPLQPFTQKLKAHSELPFKSNKVEIFQMNVGKLCNLQCSHCHVEAGPTRTELMSKDTFQTCLTLLENSDITTIDLTGGAPEMNPHLDWFITEVTKLKKRVIVRSNLTVLAIPKYAKFLDLFAETSTEVVASLPCYLEDNTDAQRGNKVFQKSIQILRELNARGYANPDTNLTLNLVHNPVGTTLAPDQSKLQADYKTHLKNNYNVEFNNLFCITNLPIKRYLDYLKAAGKYDDYMQLLIEAFNPATLDSVMCKNTISISYDGYLYDCDFNQMMEMPLKDTALRHINDIKLEALNNREIVLANHCYGCTAGAGSSCGGSLNA